MDLKKKVLFLGGDPTYLPSVKIRCLEVAKSIGADVLVDCDETSDIPSNYDIYFCVKPGMPDESVGDLRRNGLVVWDVLDRLPPEDCVDHLITSTEYAKSRLATTKPTEVIYHYHCNIERNDRRSDLRNLVWIGTEHWLPEFLPATTETKLLENAHRLDVAAMYRSAGICLNMRKKNEAAKLHVQLNSGIKLINCFGFGIPSVSDREPAYEELDVDCTLFVDDGDYQAAVERLINDKEVYSRLSENCLKLADKFSLQRISESYVHLFNAL